MNILVVVLIVLTVLILLLITFFLIVWHWLAPTNRFFTFVDEGTAKVVVRGGQAQKVLFRLKGHKMDANGYIVLAPGDEEPQRLLGGLSWVGLWPLDDVLIYTFRWTNVLHDGTINSHSAEWLDYILLKQDVYYFALERAEDADLLPLKVEILLTLRVVNPYLALFQVQDWLEAIVNRFKPIVRDTVAQGEYKELVAQRTSLGGILFTASAPLRQEFLDQYGVEVRAVEIREIEPPQEFLELTLREWEAEQEAKAKLVLADAEAGRMDREYGAVRRQGALGVLMRFWERVKS